MSLRLPGSLSARIAPTGLDSLDHEIAGEMASSLGRAGRRAEEMLERLRATPADDPLRARILADTAAAVHAWFIQRELCGMRRHDAVIREFAIPRAVLASLGAQPPR